MVIDIIAALLVSWLAVEIIWLFKKNKDGEDKTK
tara:strand:- start:394 stop:495 length:102 start_codon:yes stop_codon:yes gene_type:complete